MNTSCWRNWTPSHLLRTASKHTEAQCQEKLKWFSCKTSHLRKVAIFQVVVLPSSGQWVIWLPCWWRQYRLLKHCLTYTSVHSTTTQKIAIFVLAAMRISNVTKSFETARLKCDCLHNMHLDLKMRKNEKVCYFISTKMRNKNWKLILNVITRKYIYVHWCALYRVSRQTIKLIVLECFSVYTGTSFQSIYMSLKQNTVLSVCMYRVTLASIMAPITAILKTLYANVKYRLWNIFSISWKIQIQTWGVERKPATFTEHYSKIFCTYFSAKRFPLIVCSFVLFFLPYILGATKILQ